MITISTDVSIHTYIYMIYTHTCVTKCARHVPSMKSMQHTAQGSCENSCMVAELTTDQDSFGSLGVGDSERGQDPIPKKG